MKKAFILLLACLMLLPSAIHSFSSGIVPPPHMYTGTPMVAAISTPNPLFLPNKLLTKSPGT